MLSLHAYRRALVPAARGFETVLGDLGRAVEDIRKRMARLAHSVGEDMPIPGTIFDIGELKSSLNALIISAGEFRMQAVPSPVLFDIGAYLKTLSLEQRALGIDLQTEQAAGSCCWADPFDCTRIIDRLIADAGTFVQQGPLHVAVESVPAGAAPSALLKVAYLKISWSYPASCLLPEQERTPQTGLHAAQFLARMNNGDIEQQDREGFRRVQLWLPAAGE